MEIGIGRHADNKLRLVSFLLLYRDTRGILGGGEWNEIRRISMRKASEFFFYLREHFFFRERTSNANDRIERRVIPFEVCRKILTRELSDVLFGSEDGAPEWMLLVKDERLEHIVHGTHRHVFIHIDFLND